jgi:dipeptidyl aminopeptidase/acylaminoacyl peptidase
LRRTVVGLLIASFVGVFFGSIFVADSALHISYKPQPDPSKARDVARAGKAEWQTAEMTVPDGAVLRGWLFTPHAPNGAAVILLHGVGDTRAGVVGHADYLLTAGFTVLTPDARGHGASGGQYITFGVKEAGDVHAWADWLMRQRPITRLYGMGESMGAGIILQALATESRMRAVVAECPFVNFQEIAYDRLTQSTGIPRPPLWFILQTGYLYAQLRYGVDLHMASPLEAVRRTAVPVLLIHGMADDNIPYRHSEQLHAANPRATTLWLVPGAHHVNALGVDRAAYIRRVTDWFQEH